MPTPTTDKLKSYFPSRYIAADGNALTQYTVDSATAKTITDAALNEAANYWVGALGWFDGNTTTAALQGVAFHVRAFDDTTDTLTLSRDLPATPAAGDTFRLVIGGNRRSSQETFGLSLGGQLPELATVTGSNITGLTIKKAAPYLGEGSLTIHYDATAQELYIKMGAGNYGVGLDVSADITGGVIFDETGNGFIIVDVVAASLPGTNQDDIFTLDNALGYYAPDFEGYETSAGKIRYRLEVLKNTDSENMIDLSVYAAKPAGSATTISTDGATTAACAFNVADASDWEAKSFWIKNTTKEDCRYVKYRSGNTVYVEAADTGLRGFTATAWEVGDVLEIMPDVDIGLEAPTANVFANPADEATAPSGVTFTASDSASPLSVGDLVAGALYGVWTRETILNGHRARAEWIGDTVKSWS